MDVKEIRHVDDINLSRDMDQWCAVVNTVINRRVSKIYWQFLEWFLKKVSAPWNEQIRSLLGSEYCEDSDGQVAPERDTLEYGNGL
jgi:hypothetical protein